MSRLVLRARIGVGRASDAWTARRLCRHSRCDGILSASLHIGVRGDAQVIRPLADSAWSLFFMLSYICANELLHVLCGGDVQIDKAPLAGRASLRLVSSMHLC